MLIFYLMKANMESKLEKSNAKIQSLENQQSHRPLVTQKSAPEAKPRAFRIAIVIAAAQVYRVPILIATGFLPSYLFPNEVGDFLVGITALPVALSLRRAGLLGWAISTVWFAFGIGDIVQAAGVAVVNGNQSL